MAVAYIDAHKDRVVDGHRLKQTGQLVGADTRGLRTGFDRLQLDRAGRVRPRDEVVQDDVEPQARRKPVDRRISHEDGCEVGIGELA